MEGLPHIDEHSRQIRATPDQVWNALVSVLRTDLGGAPAPLIRLLDPTPAQRSGDWRGTPRVGDTIPGFEVVQAVAGERLALRGRHRFSRYALVFVLEARCAGGCTLRAQTWAAFPGLTGRAYRALVIGTGGHRLAVRRLLARASRRADRGA